MDAGFELSRSHPSLASPLAAQRCIRGNKSFMLLLMYTKISRVGPHRVEPSIRH